MKRARTFLAAVAVVAAGFAAQPAAADTLAVSSTTTLSADHYGPIVVAADGVTLDCAGHAVLGSVGDDVGISVNGRTGVTVENCRVFGFQHGVVVAGTSDSTLTGNLAGTNAVEGFVLADATNNIVSGNRARANGGTGFMVTAASSGNTLSENLSAGNNEGFSFPDARTMNNRIAYNTITDSRDNGVGIWNGTGRNTFVGNIVHGARASIRPPQVRSSIASRSSRG